MVVGYLIGVNVVCGLAQEIVNIFILPLQMSNPAETSTVLNWATSWENLF